MRLPSRISIKSKLILIVLTISLTALTAMSYLSWRTTQSALFEVVSTHLASVQSAQARQVEAYFASLHSQIRTLAASEMTAKAVMKFKDSFRELEEQSVSAESNKAIERYYAEQYLPALAKVIPGTPTFETYRPKHNAARHLQSNYVAYFNSAQPKDEHGEGQSESSDYSRWHDHYHRLFRNISSEFGYGDLLLIDHKTGDIVYTVQANPDLGMSLSGGPYRQSHLAKVVRAVQNNPERGIIQSIDFAPYRPQLGTPTAFLASAIYDESQMVGILAVQLSRAKLDMVMSNDGRWTEMGLGTTGESYLIDPDFRMRSISRHLQTAEDEFEMDVQSIATAPSTEDARMLALANVIGQQRIETDAAQAAVDGKSDIRLLPNYLGNSVLSAYAPLDIDGVDWAILSEIAESEIMQPVYQQQRAFLIMLTTLALLTSMLMILFASAFTRPLNRLISATQKAVDGQLDAAIYIESNDEFSQLSGQINQLVSQVRAQTNLIGERGREYDALLHTMVPPSIANQLKQRSAYPGGPQIVNRSQQVTVISATLLGLDELDEKSTLETVGHLFSTLTSSLHEASLRLGLDAPHILGEQIFVVCGLTVPRLDHAKRAVDFAQEMMDTLKRINERYQTRLQIRVGIHTGAMSAGVLGGKPGHPVGGSSGNQTGIGWFNYNLWGKPLKIAEQLSRQAGPNVVIVSDVVFERVGQLHPFVEYRTVDDGLGGRLMTWALASSLRMPQEQIMLIQMTFAKILPIADEVAQQFYDRLFALDPALQPFFKSDMREQQRKLMATLHVVISGLASPEKIIPTARDLGRKHVAYGVLDEHYDTVGEALLWTLAQGMGEDFTPEVHQAWREMYGRISFAMKMAAAER